MTKPEGVKPEGSSIALKLALVGLLCVILVIPTAFILFLVDDRESRQRGAVSEISGSWGNQQRLTGPFLTVPYLVEGRAFDTEAKRYKSVWSRHYAHFLPERLAFTGEVSPRVLHRGIYEVVVYEARIKVEGAFAQLRLDHWTPGQSIEWEDATIGLGLSDLRGLQERVSLSWAGRELPFNPGLQTKEVIESGVAAGEIFEEAPDPKRAIPFSLELVFKGSQGLNFTPLGRTTEVSLTSTWPDPSFGGAFLPDERKVSDEGFQAKWKVLDLNRGFPQRFSGSAPEIQSSDFGLELLPPVSVYQKNTRAIKYAVMFISLTFLVFFFVEVMNKKPVHPVQYTLVGLALCLYYTLLLAVSEHMSFSAAYGVSAGAIVSLISLYAWAILKSRAMAGILAAILSVLYGFLFIVLQLQDYALLIGSLGLFAILATVMYLSRRIDWYAVK